MALWRFLRGWPEEAMKAHLADLERRKVNFDAPFEEMIPENGWTVDGSEAPIGIEMTGPPVADGVFERAKQGLMNYDFSDPRIVVGHYDPAEPFVGRDMLLEIKVLGFRFLNGVRVHSVREETLEDRTFFGFRYDTLEGHIERGAEWFLLAKEHRTGEVTFKIEAHWQLGDFPTWWMKLGFMIIGDPMRILWRHLAPKRLRRLAHQPVRKPVAAPGELAHRGDITPQRTEPTET
ncbi:MAG: DUF1990 domain-containing protein [Armatimonadetes bacterium]|nr:DUF1990 domain-containing protein [Armatimonadota bacterium]